MSLDVAIQSVVFYILSCSTCSKINHRRKAKVQARKDRAEKEELETQQPGLYRHPSPFSTNPYWQEEIMMGPGPPKKNDKSKSTSQQRLNTGEQGSSYAGSTAVSSDTPSSPTAVTEDSRLSGDGWNRTRYQREDEALWGLDFHGPGQRIKEAIAKAGSSASRLLESKLGKTIEGEEVKNHPGTYYIARNPPVNDLHPPVVSTQPTSRDETRWMLQPPPSAKIMEGKERVTRSRADSNGSSRRGADEPPLSRQVTGKLVDAKLQRGESPYQDGLTTPRQIRTPNSGRPRAQRHDRQRSSSAGTSTSSEKVFKKKRKPPPISISTSARSSIDSIDNIARPSSSNNRSRTAVSDAKESSKRPALATINSSSRAVPQVEEPSIASLSKANTLSGKPQHSRCLSANVNAMPASISSNESKIPASPAYRFPRPASIENASP